MTLIEYAVGTVICGLVLFQQLRARPVRRFPAAGIFLAAIGTVALTVLAVKHVISNGQLELILLSLAITAMLGVARGALTRMWREARKVWRQGGFTTILLWILAIAQHMAFDLALPRGVGLATLSLFFGVSLISQFTTITIRSRAARFSAPLPEPRPRLGER